MLVQAWGLQAARAGTHRAAPREQYSEELERAKRKFDGLDQTHKGWLGREAVLWLGEWALQRLRPGLSEIEGEHHRCTLRGVLDGERGLGEDGFGDWVSRTLWSIDQCRRGQQHGSNGDEATKKEAEQAGVVANAVLAAEVDKKAKALQEAQATRSRLGEEAAEKNAALRRQARLLEEMSERIQGALAEIDVQHDVSSLNYKQIQELLKEHGVSHDGQAPRALPSGQQPIEELDP